MAECECVPICPFFNGKLACAMPSVVESMKKQYCLGDNSECARHIVKVSGIQVPPDLAPNNVKRAQEIVSAAEVGL